MKIVAAGGGSGGHVTPVLAVINELAKHDPKLQAHFVTDKAFGGRAAALMEHATVPVSTRTIFAGRFRRYHSVTWWRHALDIPTMLLNFRDSFFIGIGFLQSLWLLTRIKPQVVFAKGGFVCLPLGMAARVLRIPLVIHDSDTRPGLTNRVLSRWALFIGTGAPLEHYPYPLDRTFFTGIPVAPDFKPIGKARQQQYKGQLGLHDTAKPLVVVTGGGLGARAINQAIVAIAPKLLNAAAIYHITGDKNYTLVTDTAPQHIDYVIVPFVSDGMAKVFGAADVVISRAGATAVSELASMGKAVIVIPAPQLSDQVKNAATYQKMRAAKVLDEATVMANPDTLLRAILALIEDPQKRLTLAKSLHGLAKPDAAIHIAQLIVRATVSNQQQK